MFDRLSRPVRRRYYRWRSRLEWRLAPNPYPVSVGAGTARFDVSSRREYGRMQNLLGEQPIVERFLDALADDAVVWDVGAHVGTHALVVADALEDGRVVAFEPYPRNAKKLLEHRGGNDADNVEVYTIALAEDCGTAPLTLGRGFDYGGNDILTDDPDAAVNVATRSVDSLVAAGLPEPTALKIDVEGAELDVLRGATGLLSGERCRTVMCEVHVPDVLVPAVEEFLGGHGFDLHDLETTRWPPHVFATKDENPPFPP